MITRTINTADLTSECWMVQFLGLTACNNCAERGRRTCGGKEIREGLLNGKGFINAKGMKLPLPEA
ncbi:hypothetical protein ACFLQL_00380 [Verrucomicrobiota bacterium]